jgi:hypothetical protein
MFTEQSLRDHPPLVKAFTGLESEQFWELLRQMREQYPPYLHHRRQHSKRQRRVGGGRSHDLSLVVRTMLVMTYMRLHIPQATVAALFGASQSDVSRELRRLLPLIQQCLPCPVVWSVVEQEKPALCEPQLQRDTLADGRVLIDATEQRVSRPSKPEQQKALYSGKKKVHTLKTQLVSDGEHHIVAVSVAVGGATHDKTLCDHLSTLSRLPDGCEVDADKGYQGLHKQVELVSVLDEATGESELVPRLVVKTPHKKPKGDELSEQQKAFNAALSRIRIRAEHCIGWAKNWAILATRFRCDHSIYTSLMRTICGFVNAQTYRWQAAKAYSA